MIILRIKRMPRKPIFGPSRSRVHLVGSSFRLSHHAKCQISVSCLGFSEGVLANCDRFKYSLQGNRSLGGAWRDQRELTGANGPSVFLGVVRRSPERSDFSEGELQKRSVRWGCSISCLTNLTRVYLP